MRKFWTVLYLLFIALQLPFYWKVGEPVHRWEQLQTEGEQIVEDGQLPERFGRARAVFEEQLRLCEEQDWKDARLGMSYYNIGAMYWGELYYDKAKVFFTEAHRNFELNNGPESYYVAAVRARLGELDMLQGRIQPAEEHLKAAVQGIHQFMGPSDSLYLRSRSKLGLLYFFNGRYQEAREQLYPIAKQVDSDEDVGDNVFKSQVRSAIKNLRFMR